MKSKIFIFIFLFLIVSCKTKSVTISNLSASTVSADNEIKTYTTKKIKTGAENFVAYGPILANKKVGIVTNQTSLINNKIHLVDFLLEKGVYIEKIYAPEHGFRGIADAGELIIDGKDSKTNLPIISLYGNNKKPTAEQLQGIDILVFDLQDVGARFYTYISTLHYVMEACAEINIPVVILDRPNPNGSIIDGPVLDTTYRSFIGMHPIPVLHGMTIGEYGKMINGEKWLANGIQCELTIIPCSFYTRDLFYSVPVPPSPNLPNDTSINLYASLCFFEGTSVSVGRGTDKQFQIYGSPFLQNYDFTFTPLPNLGAKNPPYNGVLCFGEDLSNETPVTRLNLHWLIKAYKSSSDGSAFFTNFFTKLAGNKTLQQQIEAGLSESEIRKTWESDLESFKLKRQKYLIY